MDILAKLDRTIFITGIVAGAHYNEHLKSQIRKDVSASEDASLKKQYLLFERNGIYVSEYLNNLILYDKARKLIKTERFNNLLKQFDSMDMEQHLKEISQISLDYARQQYRFINRLSRLNDRVCYQSAKTILVFLFDKSDKYDTARS